MNLNIYVINLESSKDRKSTMIKNILNIPRFNIYIDGSLKINRKEEINLNFNFFKASVARDIEKGRINIKNYNPFILRFIRGKKLSFCEIACFHSHYRLWEECVKSNSPFIILEDDVFFEKEFCNIVDIYKSDFEYVRLMYLFHRNVKKINEKFHISFGNISGTQGYYITPNGARKFLKHAKNYLHCVDNYMDMFFIHGVLNIIYKPFMIGSDEISLNSTIQDSNKEKIPFFYKITREISRIYFFVFRKNLFLIFNFFKLKKLKSIN